MRGIQFRTLPPHAPPFVNPIYVFEHISTQYAVNAITDLFKSPSGCIVYKVFYLNLKALVELKRSTDLDINEAG